MFLPLTIAINLTALLLCLFCAITAENVAVLIMEVIFIVLNTFCLVVNIRNYSRNKRSKEKNQNW